MSHDEKTYVYVISAGPGFQKIGMAKNPKSRMRDLQIGNPIELEISHLVQPVPAHVARNIERTTHQMLRKFNCGGEWFRCGVELAAQSVEIAFTLLTIEKMHSHEIVAEFGG